MLATPNPADDRTEWEWHGVQHGNAHCIGHTRAENLDALRAVLAANRIRLSYAHAPNVATPWSQPRLRVGGLRRAATPTGLVLAALAVAVGPWWLALAVLVSLLVWCASEVR